MTNLCLSSYPRLIFLTNVALIFLVLSVLSVAHSAQFSCNSGNVTCLIAAIKNANATRGKDTITLEPGIYTIQIVDNQTDGPNGLPSITSSITIQSGGDDPAIIERGTGADDFRIFHVSGGGELVLNHLQVQGGAGDPGAAMLNRGLTSLHGCIITNNGLQGGEAGAINNRGKLTVFGSIISHNAPAHDGGGITNADGAGGNILVENSTIARNSSTGGGGIDNRSGSLIVRNSAIIFNTSAVQAVGAGIHNGNGSSVQIINSTIAKNASISGGGGIANSGGQVSISNSTIRENSAPQGPGGGIENTSGTVQIQNTIIAGNTGATSSPPFIIAPDCHGSITSLQNNLVGDVTGCTVSLQPSDLTGDPGLGTLVGTEEDAVPGRTYYPVLAGSPVIDKGSEKSCAQTDQLGNARDGVCEIGSIEFQTGIGVAIQVEGKEDNSISVKGNSPISVAILGDANFDVSSIAPSTVRLGPTQTLVRGRQRELRDVNGDGRLDLVFKVTTKSAGVSCDNPSLFLSGRTVSGESIFGSDFVDLVGC